MYSCFSDRDLKKAGEAGRDKRDEIEEASIKEIQRKHFVS
jgi:hypothetical protein